MTEKLKVGVVGVGYLGKFHAKIYAGLPNVELVGVVDANKENGKNIAEQYGCEFFESADELLDKVQAVNIVVPTSLHREVAEPFLKAGIHTLIEKPLASSVADSEALVKLAKDCGSLLQVGHLERFNAGMIGLANNVTNPRYIDAQRLGQFTVRATDVDVITDLMIHDIDIVLSLVPSKLKTVMATGTCVLTDHVDIANARLEFENGAVASITASRVARERMRKLRVFEADCYWGLDFEKQNLQKVAAGGRNVETGYPDIVTTDMQVESVMPLDEEIIHFVDCVLNNKQPLVSGEIGLQALAVADEIRESIAASAV
ncbi:MAG: putative dehydrogenase [Saprospiraceae bacterium]|jgi:predicted dehydrogenase